MPDPETRNLSRRTFLKGSSAVAAAAAVGAGVAPKRLRAQTSTAPPSERIRLGFIGTGGRAQGLMGDFLAHPDVEITALCDVYAPHLQQGAQKAGGKAELFHDFREFLEKAKVDAVVVATPPHWHPLMGIAALQAGKDLYCEKPIGLYPDEIRAMAKAARVNKRITQAGTQIHAGENFRRAVEIVRSGALGKIMNVRTNVTLNEAPGPIKTIEGPVPDGMDWDMWLGPLKKRPYNPDMVNVGHRYFKDCVHSWINELGPHIMDLAIWAMDPGEPKSVSATGGRFAIQDKSDIPDTVDVLYQYDDFTMTFVHTMCNGYNFGFANPPDKGRRLSVIFHGTNGTLAADYGSHKLYLEGISEEDFKPKIKTIPPSPGHQREFLDGIKTRRQPMCNFDYHEPLGIALTLAHVALFSGEKVGWDSEKGEVIGSKAAKRLARASYRAPWKLPKL